MIKRVLGILFTLVTLATIVFASLEWGHYRSMVFDFDLFSFGRRAEAAVEDDVLDEVFEEREETEETELVDGEAMINGGELVDGEAVDGEAMINGEGM